MNVHGPCAPRRKDGAGAAAWPRRFLRQQDRCPQSERCALLAHVRARSGEGARRGPSSISLDALLSLDAFVLTLLLLRVAVPALVSRTRFPHLFGVSLVDCR